MCQKSPRKEKVKLVRWRGRELSIQLEKLLGHVRHAVDLGLPQEEGDELNSGLRALYSNVRFLRSTEKTAAVRRANAEVVARADQAAQEQLAGALQNPSGDSTASPPYRKGRRAADDYPGADNILVDHPVLKPGDPCPCGCGGRVYPKKKRKIDLRFRGGIPIRLKIFRRQRLRCNLCGKTYKPKLPKKAGKRRYSASATAIATYLRYGQGMPLHRFASLQGHLGIPIAIATQFALALEGAIKLLPLYTEFLSVAAQAQQLGTDDTKGRVLKYNRPEELADRTGVHTTCTVVQKTQEGQQLAIFCTGPQHAGENLDDLLKNRCQQLDPLLVMCDALSRNSPKRRLSEGVKILMANCLAHGRRKFVDIAASFPIECLHVLEQLGTVYLHDKQAKDWNLDPAARLVHHQTYSQPIMDGLKQWMEKLLAENVVEENCRLGQAFLYMLNRWDKLTLFLRQPGALLDNNEVERALKLAVRHRKNSLFYLTERGALVGDIYMSLIQTCNLNGVNPVEYLTVCLRNARRLAAAPGEWTPWAFKATLQRLRDGPRRSGLPTAA